MRCRTLSTMMTAPSTIKPKSIAPRLMRLPDTPKRFIIEMAKSMDKGITEATTKPALRFPRKRIRIKITLNAPSIRLVETVLIALSTNFLRSRNGSISTPSGRVFLICSILALTALITSEELAPFSIITIPVTISPSPLRVAAP